MEYREMEGQNQSLLKQIIKYPTEYLKAKERYQEEDSEEEYFIIGKLLDLMMYDPKKIDDKFLITDLPNISEVLKSISSTIVEMMELKNIEEFDPESPKCKTIVLDSCNLHSYQKNWKNDTRIDKIFKECTGYIEILQKSKNKIIVSKDVNYKTINCKASLNSDFRTRKYFSGKFEDGFVVNLTKPVQFFKHVIVDYELDGLRIKGELDQVVINHTKKEIIPIDLKTFGRPIYTFKGQFWKLRYDFQAATYMEGLKNHPEVQKLLKNGYKLLNFRFIVVESNTTNNPLIYEVTPEVLDIGLNGGTTSKGFEYEGLRQAIERYKYHTEKDMWSYPMEYESNNIMIEI